ncbi:ATP-binding protein [Parasalinivibrio latis]|uniref:ATP-binding protein n=1 Tax=Parasalinivibrio latis TaxID=2952610 RepID=UPI0030E060CB
MADIHSERLQEMLVDLNRAEERERRFKEENNAILSAISAMSGARSKIEVFNILLRVIARYIKFENALVLTRGNDNENYDCLVATSTPCEQFPWGIGDAFTRCVAGETIIVFDASKIKEFSFFNSRQLALCQSAMLTGVTVNANESLLILLSSSKGTFNDNSRHVLERFRPLIERTIIDIDYRERLHTLVSVRTQELYDSRQRFRDFASTAGDWFWETDPDFNLSYISTPVAGLSGTDKNLLRMLTSNPAAWEKLMISKSRESGFSDLEWKLNYLNEEVWYSINGRPYYGRDGLLLGYRGTGKDVTARKKHLDELQTARNQAEAANAAKSQFLAMISHEIRTPLNSVMGLIDTLNTSTLDNDQSEWVRQMDQSAQLLLTIINDVLDLSKIESDEFKLDPESVNPCDSVTTVVNQLLETARQKGISLRSHIDKDAPELIYQDGNRFTQILFNLVGNAVKFTEQGEVIVTLSRTGPNLQLVVEDTGIGICEESKNLIFKPFTQADGSITRRYGGTGLGLSICKKLVTMMHGKITFDSQLGQGSKFTVIIPITNSLVPTKTGARSLQSNNPKRPLNILVAEDSKANQMVVKLLLEKQGHEVEIAGNGKEAIECVNKGAHYDLILMDMSMPVLDGLKATRLLREQGCTLPIVALTANAMVEDRERCIKSGMDDFITKPVRAVVLAELLEKYY